MKLQVKLATIQQLTDRRALFIGLSHSQETKQDNHLKKNKFPVIVVVIQSVKTLHVKRSLSRLLSHVIKHCCEAARKLAKQNS